MKVDRQTERLMDGLTEGCTHGQTDRYIDIDS